MKHVIVIETPEESGKLSPKLERVLARAVEIGVSETTGVVCFVQTRFNVESAVATVLEMYNVSQ